jgi:hypothetical protein
MKNIFVAISLILFLSVACTAYAEETYSTDRVQLTILDTGNWKLTLDNINYYFEWYNLSNYGRAMKVSGDDGTCYWLYEDHFHKLIITPDCSLESVSILFSNITP